MYTREEELRFFKTNIDLGDYVASYGYERDLGKSSRRHLVMKHPVGERVVISQQSSGIWCFFSPNNDMFKGTIIDFVIYHNGNCSLGEVRKILRQWTGTEAPRNYPEMKRVGDYDENKIKKIRDFVEKKPFAYASPYLEERGISRELLTSPVFKGKIREGYNGAVIFPHYDAEGVSGYEVRKHNLKLFSSGGKKALWTSNPPRTPTDIFVVESPIEALSHYALIRPDGAPFYISTGGSWGEGLLKASLKALKTPVTAAFNQDAAGNAYAEKLAKLAHSLDLPFTKQMPSEINADWNSLLQIKQAKKKK